MGDRCVWINVGIAAVFGLEFKDCVWVGVWVVVFGLAFGGRVWIRIRDCVGWRLEAAFGMVLRTVFGLVFGEWVWIGVWVWFGVLGLQMCGELGPCLDWRLRAAFGSVFAAAVLGWNLGVAFGLVFGALCLIQCLAVLNRRFGWRC